MGHPTLSVIISNYNHARFLPEAVQSLLDQSYRPHEIIILDDASTDNSIDILEQFARTNPQIRLLRNERNMGILHNLNYLLDLVSGDYLYGLAADDKILPGFLEKSMRLLARYPQAGICSTRTFIMNEEGVNMGLVRTPLVSREASFLSPEAVRQALGQYGPWIPGNTAIYRRQALVEAGGFRPELGSFCDSFAQQVIVLRHGTCFIPEPLAVWRQRDTGFAMATVANIERALPIMEHADRLIGSTYRDLFPPDYVDEWKRQWMYSMGLLAWNKVRGEQDKFLTQWRRVPVRSWIDGLFVAGLHLSIRLQRLAVLAYLLVRFRLTYKALLRQLKKIGS